MTQNCKIVNDLLPLYIDDVCSDASRAFVEGHLQNCMDCTLLLEKLKSSETDETLAQEKQIAVARQEKKLHKLGTRAGSIAAGILFVPVLVCLIVNLAAGHALDWFFIVLVSLMLTASLTVVPMMMLRNKGLWTLGTATACLLLLLGVCCIYTKGDWFPVAASASLFGVCVVLLPFAVHAEPLQRRIGRHKALVCIAADTVLFAVMMVCIALRLPSPGAYLHEAFAVSFPFVLFAWLLLAVIRYLPVNGWYKAAICTALTGLLGFFTDLRFCIKMGVPAGFPAADLLHWNWFTVDDNIRLCCLIGVLLLGVIFLLIGLTRGRKGE